MLTPLYTNRGLQLKEQASDLIKGRVSQETQRQQGKQTKMTLGEISASYTIVTANSRVSLNPSQKKHEISHERPIYLIELQGIVLAKISLKRQSEYQN